MTRISKKNIKKETIVKLYKLFFEVFSRSVNQEDFLALMDDIFSSTEKIMIVKRIGIIYLLIKEVDCVTIAETLKVSTSTVYLYSILFKQKQSKIIETIKKMLMKEKTLNFLDDFFADLIIRPGFLIGHHKLKWEHEKKQEQRKTLPI